MMIDRFDPPRPCRCSARNNCGSVRPPPSPPSAIPPKESPPISKNDRRVTPSQNRPGRGSIEVMGELVVRKAGARLAIPSQSQPAGCGGLHTACRRVEPSFSELGVGPALHRTAGGFGSVANSPSPVRRHSSTSAVARGERTFHSPPHLRSSVGNGKPWLFRWPGPQGHRKSRGGQKWRTESPGAETRTPGRVREPENGATTALAGTTRRLHVRVAARPRGVSGPAQRIVELFQRVDLIEIDSPVGDDHLAPQHVGAFAHRKFGGTRRPRLGLGKHVLAGEQIG